MGRINRRVSAALMLLLAMVVSPAPAQGIFPAPEALPELQLELAGSVNAIVRYNDGVNDYYVIGGSFHLVNGQPRNNLARLNLDGTLADEAGDGYVAAWRTGTNAPVLALTIVAGDVYVGGEFLTAGGQARSRVAKFSLTDGSLVTAWSAQPNNVVRALTSDGNGGLFIAGSFNSVGGTTRNAVAKLNAAGGLDTSWNAQITGNPTNALLRDGTSLYLCGKINKVSGTNRRAAVRVSVATGAHQSAWNPNVGPQGGATCYALAADADSVYLGGVFRRVRSTARANLAKVAKLDGDLRAWNPGTNGLVRTLALDGSGDAYVGGDFTTLASTARARLGKVTAAGAIAAAWSADANRSPRVIAFAPGDVPVVGGTFSQLGVTGVGGFARLSETTGLVDATFLGSVGGPGVVNAFAIDSAGGVIVGGAFDAVRDQGGVRQPRANLLRLTSGYAVDLAWTADTVGEVQALAIDASDDVYVGGNFTSIKGVMRNRIAKLTTAAPVVDATFNPNADATVRHLTFIGGGVYVGGDFLNIGGAARSFAARLDGTNGAASAWDPDPDGPLNTILPDGSEVLIGGNFTTLNGGGATRANLARVDNAGGAVVAGFTADTDGDVFALTLDSGQLYVGGAFADLSAQTVSNLGRVDPTTGAPDAAWLPQVSGTVRALAAGGGFMHVGGQFSIADAVSHPNLARATISGGAIDHTWQPGTDQEVRQLAYLADTTVLAGGPFDTAVGQPHGGVVRFPATSRQLTAVQNLAVAPPSVAIGEQYTISFTVANLDAPATIPTGTLSVTSVSGAENLSCAVVNYDTGTGNGSCILTSQHAGAHTITVTFTGDPEFMDSSANTPYSIAQATTTLTLSTSSPSALGATVNANLNLAASSVGAAPTGAITVEVRDVGSTLVDSCTVNPAVIGASSCALSAATFVLTAGNYTLTATYPGDANYVGDNTDAPLPHTVSQATTTTTISSQTSANTTINQNYGVTVVVTASHPSTPTGSVTISDQTGATCTIDAVAFAGGDRDCDLASLSVGTKTLRATFNATGNYTGSDNAAQAPAVTHDVTPAVTDLTLDLSAATVDIGVPVTATVTIAGNPAGSVVPTGNVVITSLNTTTAQAGPGCTIAAAGPFTCQLTFATPGDYTVTATYAESEDPNFTAATANDSITVNAIATTLQIQSPPTPTTSVFGQGIPVTVSLTANTGPANPQGTVTVSDGLGNTCQIVFDGSTTTGSCNLPSSSIGPRTLSASFDATPPFLDSGPATLGHTVSQASTTLTLSLAPANPVVGQSVTATVALSVNAPGAGAPTGNITVTGCAAPVALPGGNCTIAAGAAGVLQTITATYAGDANFTGDTDVQSMTPAKADTTFTSFGANNTTITEGQSITFTWAAGVVAPGQGVPSGNVQVSVDGNGTPPNCTAAVATGTCNIVFPNEGVFTMRADYAGDGNFNASSSATIQVTIQSGAAPQADLQVQKVVSRSRQDPPNQIEIVEFMIVVGNLGPAAVTGATVTDLLPAGLSAAVWTCTPDTVGASCSAASGGGNVNVQVTLPVSGTVTILLQGDVGDVPSLTNTASVAVPAGTDDPVPANNSSSAYYQACRFNIGATLTEHFCIFGDGFEGPP